MSLLMDALKRAEKEKQWNAHEDKDDPHVLEWQDQEGLKTKIVKSVTAGQISEKTPENPEVITDLPENSPSLELAVVDNVLPSESLAESTAVDLEIHSLESPTIEEKNLPADSATTLSWQDEIIYPVVETPIVVNPEETPVEEKNSAPSDNAAPETQKEPLILEETVGEKNATGPQAAERLFAAAATPSITKRTFWLSSLLVILVGLAIGGYLYLDTLLIGGSSLFLAKPGEKPFQRPVRQPVLPENTVPATAATEVKNEQKVTKSEEDAPDVKPTGVLTGDAVQTMANAQGLGKWTNLSESTIVKEATQDKNVAKTSEEKPAIKPTISLGKEKFSPRKTPTPSASLPEKTVAPPIKDNAQTTVVAPEEIKIIQTRRQNAPDGIKGVLDATLTQAYQALQQGDDATAQAAYTRVLRQDPNNRDVLLGLAAIALRNGHAQQAQRYYQQVLQLYPQDTVAQVGLVSAQGNNTPEYGESQLQTLLTKTPQAAYIHFNLGNLYARQGRWAQAQQSYFEAYRYDSNHADYAYNLAISLDQLNQSRLALTYYQRALELSQNRAQQDFNFDPQMVRKRLQTLTNSSN